MLPITRLVLLQYRIYQEAMQISYHMYFQSIQAYHNRADLYASANSCSMVLSVVDMRASYASHEEILRYNSQKNHQLNM